MTDEPNLQILLHKIRESYASVSHFPFASLKNKITSHFPCLPIHKNNARLSEIESARADINLSRGRSLIARKKIKKPAQNRPEYRCLFKNPGEKTLLLSTYCSLANSALTSSFEQLSTAELANIDTFLRVRMILLNRVILYCTRGKLH